MADNVVLNPYHTILGLDSAVTEPDHYELLGLQLFEDDEQAIRQAAQTQYDAAYNWRLSEYYADAKRLMDEVVDARDELLDSDAKQEYDEALREKLGLREEPKNLYHELLGLPEEITEPNYYVLLGVQPFEKDGNRIDDALTECRFRLVGLELSPDSPFFDDAERLLEEVNEAYEILRSDVKRTRYDRALRIELGLPDPESVRPAEREPVASGIDASNPYHTMLGLPENLTNPNGYQLAAWNHSRKTENASSTLFRISR